VLQKCANPICYAQFRYLHQGKLFEVEIQYRNGPSDDAPGRLGNGKGHVEWFWLCDQCAPRVSLRFVPGQGLVMVHPLAVPEEVVPIAFLQSSGRSVAEISRILIRHLDLNLTTRRNAPSVSNGRMREAA
jgi:hypothetical protein